uniref:sunset domain-containing protein n=1 Tax=Nitratireductor rhodophyticola TaxID=2854036 RepID=UPI004040F079
MSGNIYRFRRLKHADPPMFKVLTDSPRSRGRWPGWIVAVLILCGVLGYFADDLLSGKWLATLPGVGCTIKGNISVRGERIYHLPHQDYYGKTWINPVRGERWFCSEADARAAGWRKSRV